MAESRLSVARSWLLVLVPADSVVGMPADCFWEAAVDPTLPRFCTGGVFTERVFRALAEAGRFFEETVLTVLALGAFPASRVRGERRGPEEEREGGAMVGEGCI